MAELGVREAHIEEKKARPEWSREDLILALALYFDRRDGKIQNQSHAYREVAQLIGRSPAAVKMRLDNFAALDPTSTSKSLINAGIAAQAVWAEFMDRPAAVRAEARALRERLAAGGKLTPASEEPRMAMDMDERVLKAPPTPGDATFAAWLQRLGVRMSAELASAYMLGLQTKRFVIFTGISGTGKTRFAREVAKCFAVKRRVTRSGPLPGSKLSVAPYMHKDKRLTVPAAVAARLGEGRREIDVELAGRTERLRLYDAGRDVVRVLLKKEIAEAFKASTRMGDIISVEGIEDDRGEVSRLRIHVPGGSFEERLVPNACTVEVRPDWTDSHGLLGFHNPITDQYRSTPLLRLLLEAADEERAAVDEERSPAPFFAILDEMNLARVEHYFAEILSCMESDEPLKLHDSDKVEAGEVIAEEEAPIAIPKMLFIPKNVFFTGTVNIDETTHMFSAKVLDRAFVFELNEVDLEGWGKERGNWETGPFNLVKAPSTLALSPPGGADVWAKLSDLEGGALLKVLMALHRALEIERRHFAYRVAQEIATFVMLAKAQTDGSSRALWTALDWAVMSKVLPKLGGTEVQLEALLESLEAICRDSRADEGKGLGLARCAEKLAWMRRRLAQTGFCTFIE